MPEQEAAFRDLASHVQRGDGAAPRELRERAFGDEGMPPPLEGLISKVATAPGDLTDADFAAAEAAGFSQDQLFELVVCAAVGQASRQYEAGLAALAEALESGDAP
jgi:alkylhydroperoxidase family enzyme